MISKYIKLWKLGWFYFFKILLTCFYFCILTSPILILWLYLDVNSSGKLWDTANIVCALLGVVTFPVIFSASWILVFYSNKWSTMGGLIDSVLTKYDEEKM